MVSEQDGEDSVPARASVQGTLPNLSGKKKEEGEKNNRDDQEKTEAVLYMRAKQGAGDCVQRGGDVGNKCP